MKSKILHYSGEKAAVSYDVRRCIHAAACVHGLPDVFDPSRKPWIDPDRAEAEQLLQVIMRCPTGALHLERSDGEHAEPTPERNTAIVERNGPVYLRGDLEIVTAVRARFCSRTHASRSVAAGLRRTSHSAMEVMSGSGLRRTEAPTKRWRAASYQNTT